MLSACKKLLCLCAGKKSTSSPPFFWKYCEDMHTSYFGCFGNARLCTPKMIVSTSFLRYILKNPTIWLTNSILAWNLQTRNINNNISFYFRLFPGKTNDKSFQKIWKFLFWGPFWILLAHICAKMNFPGKRAVSF